MDKNKEILTLLERAQKHDQEAFGELYKLNFERVYKFVSFRVGSEAVAEDLTAEIFLKAWRMMPKYAIQQNTKFSTWLFTIAKNSVIDHYRSQRGEVSIEDVMEISQAPYKHSDHLDTMLALEGVNQAMKRLKAEYAMVIDLRYFQQLEYAEIAKIFNKNEIAVRVLLHRAIKSLRDILSDEN